MEKFKEFQGKTLDEAIQDACSYYGVEREKLEIDIINDAKSGIFGLVGAKRATVSARRVSVANLMQEAPAAEQPEEAKPAKAKPAPQKAAQQKPAQAKEQPRPKNTAPQQEQPEMAAEKMAAEPVAESAPKETRRPKKEAAPADNKGRGRNQHTTKRNNEKPAPLQEQAAGDADDADETRETTFVNLEEINFEELQQRVTEVMVKLVTPIIENPTCDVAIVEGRIRITLECGDDSGIIVGREGQTLASFQYLAARMLAKQLGGAVRLQIDVGNYRERQDDRLKELALFLGEKAKKARRPQSTRPLSAYQRRIVHLALEEDTELQTHSKGEGAHRRVVIQLRRQGGNKRRQHDTAQEGTQETPMENEGAQQEAASE